MSPVSAQAVSSLRARTGVSILECKKALDEASGDEEKAIEILRKKGITQAAKKAGREQKEGAIFSAEGNGKAVLVVVNCETDFVARDSNFKSAGETIAAAALEKGPDGAKALAEKTIPELVQKLGENISIGEVQLVTAKVTGVYVHTNGKIGVIVGVDAGERDAARDVAMHAAAMSPSFTTPADVTESDVAKEKEIWKVQLAKEGKPEAIVEKIMLGKEKKFREENALVSQPFVKDPSKTVAQYLGNATVTSYVRMTV
ncbi:translation elongation factor Ts [Candidatus Peregrinibacteria bacterium]|nr:translation elongation factor Ts [Candidatus Peregrinibacteria bacterium]